VQTSILAHRPFALFFCGRALATTGYQMQSVAVGWQMRGRLSAVNSVFIGSSNQLGDTASRTRGEGF
jgi:hypothetical protein